ISYRIIIALYIAITTGCIRNDIPYPRIQANFITVTAAGQEHDAAIDTINRVVTLYFPENVDIRNVAVEEYSITPGATLHGADMDAPLDLENPVRITLSLYQDWPWSIVARRPIERYFTVSGQVGPTLIDIPGQRVVVYVSKSVDLSRIMVETAKLGPEGSSMTPSIAGRHINAVHPVEVEVESWGRKELWTIYVEQSDTDVSTVRADAWTNVAWVYGRAEAGKDNGIEYRMQGDTEWMRVPDSDLTVDGGSFFARITHLTPQTGYEARAFSGESYGEILSFTTGSAIQIPNSSLDGWWLDGKVWNPWQEGSEQYWDTGNKGATTLGPSNSFPTDDTSSGTGLAAQLETRFVGIGMLGKLAAGNLFVGQFVRTDGTNGILSLGRPFTERPTGMRGYFKYTSAPIDYVSTEWAELRNRPDTCIVWLALIDLDEPLEIRTNPRNRQLFDPEGSYVVAYGKMQCGSTVSDYTPFEFELEYKSTSRVPKYILITASASKYGDYFTGGSGSVMYVDDLELIYDY
ncbi:MAG: PCMD domain-containing protein, partial [Muribaculaceae bacterium]|nr:PCMD domain-containing protein [Muribaculaceae bacterium]